MASRLTVVFTLSYFSLIVMSGVRQESTFILLHVSMQFSKHCLMKRLSLHRVFLTALSNIR